MIDIKDVPYLIKDKEAEVILQDRKYCNVLSRNVQMTGSTLLNDSSMRLRWIRSPLFLNPPRTKRLPELGVVLSIWRTWLSSSSSDMTLNCKSRPTGNPNSSLRRRTVRSETPRILPTSVHRNPASPCKVSNSSWASANRGFPTPSFLAVETIAGVASFSNESISLSASSAIPSKWHRSSFKMPSNWCKCPIKQISCPDDSSILEVRTL